MAEKMALTAVGHDRPGIVAAVSRALFEAGCNIEDSSMTILRGEFAMILIVSVPSEPNTLRAQLHEAGAGLGLRISLEPLAQPGPDAPARSAEPFIVSVYGADHPGIVFRVAQLLADLGVNITDVNTRVVGSAKPVYIMILEVEATAGSADLESALQSLARELRVDVSVRPLEETAL